MELIDRQAAIDAAERESQVDGSYGYMDTKSIVDMLNDLPSAQPGRKKGKWIVSKMPVTGGLELKCSNCGESLYMLFAMLNNYCPFCGADMRGKEDA